MDTKIQHGYLVLADISGYTAFLAGSELDHAHEVMSELLELIIERFTTVLTLSKLEGDAVFAYTAESKLPRGETLVELLESTYVAFKDRVEAVHRRTTCTCNACRAIPALDLKFMAHHGDYIFQKAAGITELIGSDVNLVHRLLKNHIKEATGWNAYALFTEKCLDHLSLKPEGMHAQTETYEHLGDVQTHSLNLRARYKELTETRHIVVTRDEALITAALHYPVPPTVVWDWINDPHRRAQYTFQPGLEFRAILRPGGRTGVGARNHCMHGKDQAMEEDILDWKPFEYITVVQKFSGFTMLMTAKLTPAANGTQMEIFIKGRSPAPGFLNRPLFVLVLTKAFPMPKLFENMGRCIAEEMAREQNETLLPVMAAAG